jgi:hypothetical protein
MNRSPRTLIASLRGHRSAPQPPGATTRRDDSLAIRGLLLLCGVSYAVALCASGWMAARVSPPRQDSRSDAAAAKMAEAGGLWFTVQSDGWEDRTLRASQATASPATVNSVNRPQQFAVELKIQNRGDQARMVEPEDFRLAGADGTTWPAAPTAFPAATLRPREYLHAVLGFNIPPTASGLHLIWSRHAQEVRLAVGRPSVGSDNPDADGKDRAGCIPTPAVRCADAFRAANQPGESRE